MTDTEPGPALIPLALALALGAAVSLGITRFAYGLLLPPMRLDLHWSYALAGAMNTANALGYFVGALAAPWLMRSRGPSFTLIVGTLTATLFMFVTGFFTDTNVLLLLRVLAGMASALVFVAGGLLAARLGGRDPKRSGLILGLYYGGTGVGIVVSSLSVHALLGDASAEADAWRWAWWALGAVCLLFSLVQMWPARIMASWAVPVTAAGSAVRGFHWPQFGFGLAGYTLFGVGYIGYMTFVVALLRNQGHSGAEITVFYSLLGVAVMASSRLWAGLLDKYRDGRPQALLNGLLGIATLLPALTHNWFWVLLSGLMFGSVFLSVVASTTALVRHNLPQTAWAAGIGAFTMVFAAGQIVGPTVVGWIADGEGGLERGLVFSACALWLGAALALRQRSVSPNQP